MILAHDLLDKTIICSGTTMGSIRWIVFYLERMLTYMDLLRQRYREFFATYINHDQPIHNHIIHTFDWPESGLHVFPLVDSPVMTLALFRTQFQWDKRSATVLMRDGSVHPPQQLTQEQQQRQQRQSRQQQQYQSWLRQWNRDQQPQSDADETRASATATSSSSSLNVQNVPVPVIHQYDRSRKIRDDIARKFEAFDNFATEHSRKTRKKKRRDELPTPNSARLARDSNA
jgi:hypothetical protein